MYIDGMYAICIQDFASLISTLIRHQYELEVQGYVNVH